jgi:hypothetical protein
LPELRRIKSLWTNKFSSRRLTMNSSKSVSRARNRN